MLSLQNIVSCGRAGFCEQILRFLQAKILEFVLWLSAKDPSMQPTMFFHYAFTHHILP